MRHVDSRPFASFVGEIVSEKLGTPPQLMWLPIANLRIDETYQREVLRNGARNIGRIARSFDWSLFGVVVVAPLGDGLYAIVDGQHRTIAADFRGIIKVPCVVIAADPGKQAKAFAAINGSVTAIHPLAIFAADVSAGDAEAVRLRDVCLAGAVTICRTPVPSNLMKPGQTIAVGTLKECLKSYGADHLALALRCITIHGTQGTGLVKSPAIKAICHVLDAERSWMTPESRLVKAMAKFDLRNELNKADVEARQKRMRHHSALALRLFDYLDAEIGA